MWLCMLWSKLFKKTSKETHGEKDKQMQPMWLCVEVGKQFEDSYIEKNILHKPKVMRSAPHFLKVTQIEFDHDNYAIMIIRKEKNEKSFKYFTHELLRKWLLQIICYFKSPISPWRGPQWRSQFWSFLLDLLWSPSTQKISFHWAPFLSLTFGLISSMFVFLIFAAIFGVKD